MRGDAADNASYIDFDLEKPHPKYPNPVPVQLLTPMAADKSGARQHGGVARARLPRPPLRWPGPNYRTMSIMPGSGNPK